MTRREWNLIKEAVCRARYECEDKASPPGPDSWRSGEGKVTLPEAVEIRKYVRSLRAWMKEEA